MKSDSKKMGDLWSELVEQVAERTADLVEERLGPELAGAAPAEGEEVLSVPEAADFLDLGQSTVYKKAASGELPSVKLGGRRVFLRSDLEAYIEAHRWGDDLVVELARDARRDE